MRARDSMYWNRSENVLEILKVDNFRFFFFSNLVKFPDPCFLHNVVIVPKFDVML